MGSEMCIRDRNDTENELSIINANISISTSNLEVNYLVPDDGEVVALLVNIIGEIVLMQKQNANKGKNTIKEIRNQGFVPGMYYLSIIYNNEIKSLKVMCCK